MKPQIKVVRSVDELRDLIEQKWKEGEAEAARLRSRRIEVGFLLLELRDRVEAGEVGELATWWEWFADNFTRSRADAEKLMALASADDPEAAAAAERERNAQYKRDQRERERAVPPADIGHVSGKGSLAPPPCPAPPPRQIIATPTLGPVSRAKVEELIEMFLDLSAPEREVFMDRALQIMAKDGVSYF